MLKSSFLSLAAAATTAVALAASAAAQPSDDGGPILTAYSGGAAPSKHQPPTHAYTPQPVNTVERPGFYLSGGASWTHFNGRQGVNLDTWSFTGRIGWQMNPWLAFEFDGTPPTNQKRYTFDGPEREIGIDVNGNGTLDDIITEQARFDVNYLLGPYAKLSYPIMNKFALFARLGWAFVDVDNKVELPNGTVAHNLIANGSDDGFSAGAGGEWGFDEHSSVRIDYTWADIALAGPNQVAISYQYKF
jgi:opacity protein-like surface antigen